MRRTRALPALLSLLALGCGEAFTNAALTEDEAFVAAAPSALVIRLAGPPAAAPPADRPPTPAAPAEPAELYALTRRVTRAMNGLAHQLLRVVDDALEEPPSERAPDRRVWAPTPHPLDPRASRFTVARMAGGFEYALEQRPRGESGASWRPVLVGELHEVEDGEVGALTLDFDATRQLGGGGARGQLEVAHAQRGGGLTLTLEFRGVVLDRDAAPLDTVYTYEESAAGEGRFDFDLPTEQGGALAIRSRWRADGAGRADARVDEVGGTYRLSECWGADFARTYWEIDAGEAGRHTEGDPEACHFPAEPPG